MSTNQAKGFATPLSINSFPFYKIGLCPGAGYSAACPTGWAEEEHEGFPGGGVFLILLFVPLTVYFAAGTGYNFLFEITHFHDLLFDNSRLSLCSKTGSAAIPNKAFWTGLPGLIVAGFKFTFVEFFGFRGSSSAGGYAKQSNEGYGTLGN